MGFLVVAIVILIVQICLPFCSGTGQDDAVCSVAAAMNIDSQDTDFTCSTDGVPTFDPCSSFWFYCDGSSSIDKIQIGGLVGMLMIHR